MGRNKQNGITLVALVVTIIILIILAGISISALSGSGLFERAQQAKEITEQKTSEENAKLYEYEQWLKNYENGKIITNVDPNRTNPEAAMPTGATLVEGDATKGIVIKDSKQNEWVWVEVPKTIFKNAKSADAYNDIKTDLIEYAKDYREGSSGQGRYWKDEYYEGCGITATEDKTATEVYTEMYNKMLSSVYTNGGFWISRYEAGIKGSDIDINKARTESSTRITNDTIATLPEAVSQANMIPYNYVYCSEAQTLASRMSTDTNKTSSLLFGIQWDLVCKFLQEKGGLSVTQIKGGDNIGSKNWGNYNNAKVTPIKTGAKQLISGTWTASTDDKPASSILLTTGASDYTKKMNIYDFAGNEWEWTLEHATSTPSSPCTRRGGGYGYDGSECTASYRSSFFTTNNYDYVGFRSTLY